MTGLGSFPRLRGGRSTSDAAVEGERWPGDDDATPPGMDAVSPLGVPALLIGGKSAPGNVQSASLLIMLGVASDRERSLVSEW